MPDKLIDQLKQINIDSTTAERIAHEYITYLYIDSITKLLVIAMFIALCAYGLKKMIESAKF